MTPVEQFFSAWGMPDADDRKAAIFAAVTPDITYADPRTDAPITGADALAEYVSMFSQTAPGAVAVVVKSDIIHGAMRVTVAFRMPGGTEQHGQYFAEPTEGPIARLTGFVGTGAPE